MIKMVAVLFCLALVTTLSRAQPLMVGVGEVDITPPLGNRIAGYFNERIATGIHDPLHAKALVIRQGHTEIGLVFCDLIGLSLNVTTNARARASSLTGIPVPNIMIAATHCHTGPLFDDVRGYYLHQAALSDHGVDEHQTIDYPAFLTERVAQLLAEAHAKLRPADLYAGVGLVEGVAFNRRYLMKNGKVRFNPGRLNPEIVRPAGSVDNSLGVLLAYERAQANQADFERLPFAGITVFGVHSDTVGGTLYSADFEYYLEQSLRGAFGSNYVSAFGLGTCGDVNHINVHQQEPTYGFAVAERIGQALAAEELALRPNLRRLANPSLEARSATLRVALQKPSPSQMAFARQHAAHLTDTNLDFYQRVAIVKTLDLAQRGSFVPMEVQVFRFDAETSLVCLPGEIFAELGLAIKRASPFKTTLVMTVCNDRPSYVPTKRAFAEGSYEVSNARVQCGTGERLVQEALKLLRELRASP